MATLGSAIPREAMAGSLLWWRFYVFYLPVVLGGAAGLLLFGKRSFLGPRTMGPGEAPTTRRRRPLGGAPLHGS